MDTAEEDLVSLKRQLQNRSLERESVEAFFARERAQLGAARATLDHSVAATSDVLSVRRRQAHDYERDATTQSAVRQRHLHFKEERIAQVELQVADSKKQQAELQAEVDGLNRKLSELRRLLAEVQHNADVTLTGVRQSEAKLSEARRALQSGNLVSQNYATQNATRREALEASLASAEAECVAVADGVKRQVVLCASSETAHCDRLALKKVRVDELQAQQDEAKAQLVNLRRALSNLQNDEEEAARRRRKMEEEVTREYLAERKVESLRAAQVRDELLRQLRADMEKNAAALTASIEELTSLLAPVREESNALFEEEMALHSEISLLKERLVGCGELETRRTMGKDRVAQLQRQMDEAVQQRELLQQVQRDLTERIQMTQDTIAPMGDVEESIAALQQQLFARRQQMADVEAKSVVQSVAVEGRLQRLSEEIRLTQETTQASYGRQVELQDELTERRRQLEGEMRVLLTEEEALDAKILEVGNKGKLLEASVEHNTRQKRLLLEDLEVRRELARKAAASLLAQLE